MSSASAKEASLKFQMRETLQRNLQRTGLSLRSDTKRAGDWANRTHGSLGKFTDSVQDLGKEAGMNATRKSLIESPESGLGSGTVHIKDLLKSNG